MKTKLFFFFAIVISMFSCSTLIQPHTTASTPKITQLGQNKISKTSIAQIMEAAAPASICGSPFPKKLGDLNELDIYTSNITMTVGTSLSAYGFNGNFNSKDVLIAAYLVKHKDYDCANNSKKRAMAGIRIYVHASDFGLKLSSPGLAQIAAAVQLDCAKAEYHFEIFGLSPNDLYTKLPSAAFDVDTYSKVIAAYDEIVHSLKDDTAIDPIIGDVADGQIVTNK